LLTLLTRDIQRTMAAHVPYGIYGTPGPVARAEAPRRVDRLMLLTVPPPAGFNQDAPSGGALQRVRYVFTASPTGHTLALQRAVATLGGKQTEHFMPVHEHVQIFHLRYFDGQTWSDTWQQAEVPRAMEITLVVQGGGLQPRTYTFATLVTAD